MSLTHARALDLNLLLAFHALFEQRQVTRAAATCGVTQSAMSYSLARLREHLGDVLFVRTPRGLLPTPRAEKLAPVVTQWLAELDRALAPAAPFDASTLERTFVVAGADYTEIVLLPALLARLRTEAPRVALRLRPASNELDEDLGRGGIDLALAPPVLLSPRLVAPRLFEDTFVCVVRRGHPAVKRRLTLRQFVQLDHIQISIRGTPGGPVEDALARQGLRRTIALYVPHFLAAPLLVEKSDLVLTLPSRFAAILAPRYDVEVHPTPLEVEGFAVHAIWHEMRQADPEHAWLRALIAEVARGL